MAALRISQTGSQAAAGMLQIRSSEWTTRIQSSRSSLAYRNHGRVVSSFATNSGTSISTGEEDGKSSKAAPDVPRPPRICTLRAFRSEDSMQESFRQAVWSENPKKFGDSSSVFFKPLAANVEATAQARNFETLSGRVAMVVFAVALGAEYVTGHGVFKGIELEAACKATAICAVSLVFAVSFAAAWGVKNHIGVYMTKGCQDIVEAALEDVLDGLFYEEEQQ